MLQSDSQRSSQCPGSGRGVLHVYVVPGCRACKRTLQVVESCEEIQELVDVSVASIESDADPVPKGVVGAPTIVFEGKVVSLGTPDCRQLAARLRQQMNERESI